VPAKRRLDGFASSEASRGKIRRRVRAVSPAVSGGEDGDETEEEIRTTTTMTNRDDDPR
jgi:hypothetical protein